MRFTASAVVVAGIGLGLLAAPASGQNADPELVEQARALAEPRSVATFERQCTIEPARFPGLGEGVPARPAKLFDNLYYVGRTDVGAWVIQTSDGLALIDTLYNAEDAEQVIVAGMRELGLDPDLLRVVFVTHFHGDHSGGAAYFQERSVRVMLSEADWDRLGGPPDANSTAHDGQTVMIGDTPITIILTPGHTPGAISLVFPVFEEGERHVAAVMELSPRGGIDVHREAIVGLEHLAQFAAGAGVDVALHPHEMIFDPTARDFIMSASSRSAGDSNPLVIGEESVQRFAEMVTTCWRARIATMEADE